MSVGTTGAPMHPRRIVELRERYAAREGSLRQLAPQYQLSHNGAWLIVTGRIHQDIGGPITLSPSRLHHGWSSTKRVPVIDDVLIRQVRRSVVTGGMSEAEAHRTYGISQQYISDIVRGNVRIEAGGPTMDRKRTPRGESLPHAKLTTAKVQEILLHYARKDMTLPAMAKEYEVSIATISKVVYRRSWKHVQIPEVK